MTCGFIYPRYLVAHGEEGGERETEGLRAVEGHEVAHVLEEEVLGAQEVGEREEREDHLALHLAPRVLIEAVHAGEALRGREGGGRGGMREGGRVRGMERGRAEVKGKKCAGVCVPHFSGTAHAPRARVDVVHARAALIGRRAGAGSSVQEGKSVKQDQPTCSAGRSEHKAFEFGLHH